jgi:general stress protein 26
MTKEEAIEKGHNLADRSAIAMLGSIGAEGYPCIKAMIKVENEGIKTIWFSTNTSSKRVGELASNPKACVYFVDQEKWMGLLLTGTVEILQDPESRKRLWREGCEIYYRQGVNDPDYTVLRFTAHKGNYYNNLENISFEL